MTLQFEPNMIFASLLQWAVLLIPSLLGLWLLVRDRSIESTPRTLWAIVILLVPIFGTAAFLLFQLFEKLFGPKPNS